MILSVKMLHFRTTYPQRAHHVDSTWILRRNVEDQISTNFHVISAYFFDVVSVVEKSTYFPRTFFNVFRWSKNPRYFHVVFSI